MQSRPHWLPLKQQARRMRLRCISGCGLGTKVVILVVAILPKKARGTHIRKQSYVPNRAICHAWGHCRDEVPWVDVNLPFSQLQPFKVILKELSHLKYTLLCSAPAKVIFWLYPHVAALRECLHPHHVPSRDPRRCGAALEAGASYIGQKQQPKVLGGVWLFFSRCETGWDRVWFYHCWDWFLGLCFWAFTPILE